MTFRTWILRATATTILVAAIKYFIIEPIYDKAVNLAPLVMLGIGIIIVTILFKVLAKFGSFTAICMLIFVGIILIIIGW